MNPGLCVRSRSLIISDVLVSKKYVDAQGRVDHPTLKAKDTDAVENLYSVIAATRRTFAPTVSEVQ